MTTDDFIKEQHRKLSILKTGIQIQIAAQDTHVKMDERIFEKGETTQGNKLGYNSSDPLYVNPQTQSPKKFPTKGKTGKTKFANGEPHKTGYFESYKEFRQKIGRESGFMNLELNGILRGDFSKALTKVDSDTYIATISKHNSGKVDKFSSYFKLNKEERKNFRDVLEDETLRILR